MTKYLLISLAFVASMVVMIVPVIAQPPFPMATGGTNASPCNAPCLATTGIHGVTTGFFSAALSVPGATNFIWAGLSWGATAASPLFWDSTATTGGIIGGTYTSGGTGSPTVTTAQYCTLTNGSVTMHIYPTSNNNFASGAALTPIAFSSGLSPLTTMTWGAGTATTCPTGTANVKTVVGPPSLASVVYISGLTVVGAAGTTVVVTSLNNGSTGSFQLKLTSTNFIANYSYATAITPGSGATGPPTTGTCAAGGSNPAVSCTGTILFESVVGTNVWVPAGKTVSASNIDLNALSAFAPTVGTDTFGALSIAGLGSVPALQLIFADVTAGGSFAGTLDVEASAANTSASPITTSTLTPGSNNEFCPFLFANYDAAVTSPTATWPGSALLNTQTAVSGTRTGNAVGFLQQSTATGFTSSTAFSGTNTNGVGVIIPCYK